MDREQMTYAITLEWLYNVIKGDHEKAHDVICKMTQKSPDIIHDIFACTSIILSNFAGILKSTNKENENYINKFCEDMISEKKPEEVFEQFMSEEDYNDPDDFENPSKYAGAPYDRERDEEDVRRAHYNSARRRIKKTEAEIKKTESQTSGVKELTGFLKDELNEIKEQKRKLANLKFVGVTFDYKKKELGEKEVNQALTDGYQVLETIKTESGVVIVMGMYRDEKND